LRKGKGIEFSGWFNSFITHNWRERSNPCWARRETGRIQKKPAEKKGGRGHLRSGPPVKMFK